MIIFMIAISIIDLNFWSDFKIIKLMQKLFKSQLCINSETVI